VKRIVAAIVLVLPLWAGAQATDVEQARINALLKAIEDSDCQFERNGTQYSAAEGVSHLRMKLDFAGPRVQTASQFIERIATGSSQSGRPYRVLCPGLPAQTSRQWLEQRLSELVSAGK
jgi:hypothetical protein